MNAFNQSQLAEDESGLLESCDRCNALIHNWDWLENAWWTDDGVMCKRCHSESYHGMLREFTEKLDRDVKSGEFKKFFEGLGYEFETD